MIEVEIKVRLNEKEFSEIESKLKTLSFSFEKKMCEIDIYYNGIDRNFAITDEALRIRTSENLNTHTIQSYVTYKGKKLDTISKTRLEYDVAVEDGPTMNNLLKSLGFADVHTVEKVRDYYKYENIHACVDYVQNVGHYIELEKIIALDGEKNSALDELFLLLTKLGINKDKLERKSYLQLLIENVNKQ